MRKPERSERPNRGARPAPKPAPKPATVRARPEVVNPEVDRAVAPTEEFLAAAAGLGIEFEPTDLERLRKFLELMLRTNETTNLTAIKDPVAAWMRHIFDALTLVPVIASVPGATEGAKVRVIDVGSGGGVPALPLAIVMPEVEFTLVEATGKKVAFLTDAAAALGLANVVVLQDRAERLGQEHKTHRERYDVATARALGHLAVVVELTGPLVRPGGFVIAVKGAKAEQEIEESGKALGQIGLKHAETISTPTGRVVVMEKTTRTPRAYPRKDGEPARLPLGVGLQSSPKSEGLRAD